MRISDFFWQKKKLSNNINNKKPKHRLWRNFENLFLKQHLHSRHDTSPQGGTANTAKNPRLQRTITMSSGGTGKEASLFWIQWIQLNNRSLEELHCHWDASEENMQHIFYIIGIFQKCCVTGKPEAWAHEHTGNG